MPEVSVIVVNWNRREILRQCLESLREQTLKDHEVILVDNGSTDGSREMVEAGYPEVIFLGNGANTGFCAASNQGIRAARGEFIALINNDARADSRWLEEMTAALKRSPGAGMCAPKILRSSPDGCLDSAGMGLFPDGSSRGRGRSRPDKGRFDNDSEALLPSGCAAMYRRSALEDAGLFDEDFFAYCEDTDLGLRCRLRGWSCAFAPRAMVYHRYSSLGGDPARKFFLLERNHYFVAIKTFPAALLLALPLFTALRVLMQVAGLAGLKGNGGRRRAILSAALSAYADLLRKLPLLMKKRAAIRGKRKVPDSAFMLWLLKYGLSPGELCLKDE